MQRAATAVLAGAFACGAAAASTPTHTPAGSQVANTATLITGAGDAATRTPSNTVVLTIDELLDVTVARVVARVTLSGEATLPVAFLVTNPGNGAETFDLAGGAPAGVQVIGLALDSDADGAYDTARDTAIADHRLALAPGEQRRVFVLVRATAADATGAVALTATATTGHGDPGTIFARRGIGGVDAIVGATGAQSRAETPLSAAVVAPTLIKSQSVLAPDGSARVMPGSVVTYRLDATLPEGTQSAEVSDPIPAGTRFVPGSITLDDHPLTDAEDGDAAGFDGTAIAVRLGDATAASVRSIRFKVAIQ